MKNLMKETAAPPENVPLSELFSGCIVGFGFMPQKNISGKRIPVVEVNSYLFEADNFIAYRLDADSAELNLIVAEDDDEANSYLALSQRIEPRLYASLFGEHTPEFWFALHEGEDMNVNADVLGPLSGWLAEDYTLLVAAKGRFFEGDYRMRKQQDRARLSRPIDYVLLVDDDNEYALEAEKYEDGTLHVFATVYRPTTDIGEIARSSKSGSASMLNTEAPAVALSFSVEKIAHERPVDLGAVKAKETSFEPEAKKSELAMTIVVPEAAAQSVPETKDELPAVKAVEAPVLSDAADTHRPIVDVSAGIMLKVPEEASSVMTPPASAKMPKAKKDEPVSAAASSASDTAVQVASAALQEARKVTEEDSPETETRPDEKQPLVSELTAEPRIPPVVIFVADSESAKTGTSETPEIGAALEANALNAPTESEPSALVSEEKESVSVQPMKELLTELAKEVETASPASDESISRELATGTAAAPAGSEVLPVRSKFGRIQHAGAYARDADLLTCSLPLASRLIDEAQRNHLALSEIIRKVIDLPARVNDHILIPFKLEDHEQAELARRYQVDGNDPDAIKQHILEELERFVGSKK